MRYLLVLCFIGLTMAFGLSLLITAAGDPTLVNRLRALESHVYEFRVSDIHMSGLCVEGVCASDVLDALAAPYRKGTPHRSPAGSELQ
jgi:hypothetical protein